MTNDDGVHQAAPGADLLCPRVRDLLGRHPHRGRRSWRISRHPRAGRAAVSVRDAGVVRRPQRRQPPGDRPRRWTGGPSRARIAAAPVAGGRALVRGRAPDRPARVCGALVCALAHLPCVPPHHPHHERQGCPAADGARVRADGGGSVRGAGLDGVRRAPAAAAVRGADHRAHGGGAVGRVPLQRDLLGRQSLRSAPAGHLACAALRVDAGLPGAHGVGLRPYAEPARGDAHAREFSQAAC